MKYFVLILTLIYLYGIIKGCFKIHTKKEFIDNLLETNPEMKKNTELTGWTLIITSLVPIIYLISSMIYIGQFWFSIICFVYLAWSLYDLEDYLKYLKDKTISKTLDSKMYKIISIPFDLIFAIFMVYQIFIKW